MIAGIFHQGSGLGNQLHRYVGTRVLALDRGEKHGMVAPPFFKGSHFMELEINNAQVDCKVEYPSGKVVIEDLKGIDVVDGEFQNETDFMHRIDEVRDWLRVEPMEMPDDLCIISHRGGEYTMFPDLYLANDYWDGAIEVMLDINPNMRFEVQTDDEVSAHIQFPLFPIVQSMEYNWRAIRYAKYLIVGNSSFSILPSLTNEDVKMMLAPKYHAGHNKGYWQEPNNHYKKYIYV